MILTEKYRLLEENNSIYNDDVKKILITSLQKKNIPHLILFGNPGLGKSTFAITLAKLLYAIDSNEDHDWNKWFSQIDIYNKKILFLNA